MSTIHENALQLFLSESTALALTGSVTGDVNMASALDKRHKIRKTDLEKVYNAACRQDPNTPQRAITVSYLMLMAGCAYDNPFGLINAPDLSNYSVTPHWDKNKPHRLSAVYLWEPMNLWAGWAWENRHNASETIDSHYHDVFEKITGGAQRSTSMNCTATTLTTNVRISQCIAPNTQTTFAPRPANTKLERQMSAYSANLELNKEIWKHAPDKFENATVDNTRRWKEKHMRCLISEVNASSVAGDMHYSALLNSLIARGKKASDDYKRLENARENWTKFRLKLVTYLDFISLNWAFDDSPFK
ncbi:hypothetical protein [Massilia aquatica]|uniref:Uncharacterized protein n=1 Tax=Massilia aquatica TaxID=2609000 RepID=A0ABX0MH33_9BURK|nr:hypothetical protein [Massilia aquatica]NHZ44230.1 hypothetical protein [Massilia aquatica]